MSDPLTQSPAWQALRKLQGAGPVQLREAFAADAERFRNYSIHHAGILLDYSKHLVSAEIMAALIDLAAERGLPTWREKLFAGEKINTTERRAALHTALRAERPVMVDGRDVMADVVRVRAQMRRFATGVRDGSLTGASGRRYTDVINIGIGGSDLGPAFAVDALAPYAGDGPRLHFMSNVDGASVDATLQELDPETTLVIVASKTFTTQETLANATTVRAWLEGRLAGKAAAHFVAVTANVRAAQAFGISAERIFEFWDWVGGRYSLWSAVGLPIALAAGMDNYEALLRGARGMDEHFRSAPLERNMPVVMALIGVWYIDFSGCGSHAVLPYDYRLRRLPDYLQQLEMESCGKRVTRDGVPVEYATAPVIWGAPGTNGQHAFYQMLHQGTQIVPADFIACCVPHHAHADHHAIMLAHFFAQTEALMKGKTAAEAQAEMTVAGLAADEAARLAPHRAFPGNRPSSSLLVSELTPETLGALIALYEHKVFVQSVVWDINAFDQWGVELGKRLADRILPELGPGHTVMEHDASTRGLIEYFKSAKSRTDQEEK
jgi:glucose-6-phosphate isomerase